MKKFYKRAENRKMFEKKINFLFGTQAQIFLAGADFFCYYI
jgi:hypothetical protein